MKVLITGGCGYIGYSLLEELLLKGELEEVILYDNLSRKNSNFFIGLKFPNLEKLRFIQGDILDNYKFERALKGVDIVIHMAAKASTPFADNNSHEFDQVNNWGTAMVASAVEKSDSVKKLIYLSSISVFGNTKGEIVDENTKAIPKSFYGISKFRGEKHIQRLSPKIKTYILRAGNVFGYNPSMRLEAVINRFMFDAQFKGKIEIHGSGEQKRPFVEVTWLGKVIANLALENSQEPGLYNLVNYNLSVNEIADTIKTIFPPLEMIFLDQHIEMRSITATSIKELKPILYVNPLTYYLQNLKHKFRF